MAKSKSTIVPLERVESKILVIRGQRVMLDSDLAEIYGVDTKRLNEQVKRNRKRFPEDFMFRLTKKELIDWKSQIATSNPSSKMGLRKLPHAFTEHGAVMLASVLNSPTAVNASIMVVRAFIQLFIVIPENRGGFCGVVYPGSILRLIGSRIILIDSKFRDDTAERILSASHRLNQWSQKNRRLDSEYKNIRKFQIQWQMAKEEPSSQHPNAKHSSFRRGATENTGRGAERTPGSCEGFLFRDHEK